MKRNLLILLLVLFSVGLAFAQAKILMPESIHDFGKVIQGEKLNHAFLVKNGGTSTLKIDMKELSVTGLTARFKEEVEPGGEALLKLEWNTTYASGPTTAGVMFTSNEPGREGFTVFLKADVQPAFGFDPMKAFFFSVWKGETLTRTMRVTNMESASRKITHIQPKGTHFQAQLKPVQEGKTYDVVVSVPAKTPPGRYIEFLTLYTDHPQVATIDIPVNVFVKEDLYVSPDALDFGTINRATVAPAMVQYLSDVVLVKKHQGDFAIREVKCNLPFLKITQTPATGRSQIFQLEMDVVFEKLVPGKINGEIVIRTDDPRFPELRVQLEGEVL